jgi:F420-dependent oxidoreductase-like protein
MRMGMHVDLRLSVDGVCDQVEGFRDQGFSSVWAAQIFGYDALGLLAVVGARVPGIDLGTAVVPVYSRLPQVMAQQALTVQAAADGRLLLGIGMSHRIVVEGMWGLSYDRPARYLKEYLSALTPLLRGEVPHFQGEVLKATSIGPIEVRGVEPPPVLVAALGPTMLQLAGRMADGTVTWMTGTATLRDHIVPTITEAATAAGRPSPRVVAALPVAVTGDADRVRRRIDEAFAIYPTLPSYRAMLEREGASSASDVSIVGDEEAVASGVREVARAGVTDLVAALVGTDEERARTAELLLSLAS